MSFSDEDLRALKDRLKVNHYSVGSRVVVDLIGRLEAAEAYIASSICDQDSTVEMAKCWKAWQKECGK